MKNYTITKEQLRSITDPQVKEWFPDAFSLEIGNWYKSDLGSIIFLTEIKKFTGGFGVNVSMGFVISDSWISNAGWIPATNVEVTEALTKEAIKRGLVKGVEVTQINHRNVGNDQNKNPFKIVNNNYWLPKKSGFFIDNICLMDLEGNWAEVIQIITKAEAEKILNKKIVG